MRRALTRLLVPALLALLSPVLGCDRAPPSERSKSASASLDSSVPAPSIAPAVGMSPLADAASAPLDPATVRARVSAFFAQFADGASFEFLRASCESPVERFVTAEHADIGAVIASSARFFRGKRLLKYAPDLGGLQTEARGDVTVARVPLTMTWATKPPATWGLAADDDDAAAPAPDVDPLWAGLVAHEAKVDVELAFAPDGRIRRYVEGPAHHATLRATGASECSDVFEGGPPITVLKKGARVDDLGDTFAPSISPKGPQIVRRVQRAGAELWVSDTRSFAVPNPSGGTSAGSATCLEAVATAAAPKDAPLECRASHGAQTVELFLAWDKNTAAGSLRTTEGDGGVTARSVQAELYKGLVLVNPAGVSDPGTRLATVQTEGVKSIQVGDWHQPWLPCAGP